MGKIFPITSRRNFLGNLLTLIGVPLLTPAVSSCHKSVIKGKIVGPNSATGHRLRTGKFPPVARTVETDVVVVGGGVSGLSAARVLTKQGVDFKVLELDNAPGGNSIGGTSNVSNYPWGAHYLPLPLHTDKVYLDFLAEAGVVKGWSNGLPVYDEYAICFDSKERLLINNFWQEGLTPTAGLPEADKLEIQRFLEQMEQFKVAKGSDGNDAFAIPVSDSSADREYRQLDEISMQQFLDKHGYVSPYLHWYVNYCCLDDFGATIGETSAWAGIHYFASRKGCAANVPADSVLTWPEGNHWLVKKLAEQSHDRIITGALVYNISEGEKISVTYFDAAANQSIDVVCNRVIVATPQFITQRLLGHQGASDFRYAPWVVANITLTHGLSERRGDELSWDNVIYGASHLGYIHANHQSVNQPSSDKRIITYYRALFGNESEQRKRAFETTYEQWIDLIINDLSKAHTDIKSSIEEINIYVWGHGMIKPSPGFIWNENRTRQDSGIGKKIYLAHSDLSGISIFEEAFHNGIRAAQAIVNESTKH